MPPHWPGYAGPPLSIDSLIDDLQVATAPRQHDFSGRDELRDGAPNCRYR